MLRPRLIPFLLVRDGGLVKTRRFAPDKYVGDPINTVRIFNEKHVDEIVVLDIDATTKGHEPDTKLIAHLAAECRMPLCYGGGVRTVEHVEKIVSLGVEKVAISAAALANPGLISATAKRVGSQSVVVVLDVKNTGIFKRAEVVTHNGTRRTGRDPLEWAKEVEQRGAGEIVVNSVDRDGEMCGYDLDLAFKLREVLSLPLTIVGGAGSMADAEALVSKVGVVGVGAGSLFVFKGRLRAVLVNYPTPADKAKAWARAIPSRSRT
jgi:cyclase